MSWPQWPVSGTAQVTWPTTAALTTTIPGTPYTPEQWAAMQQQNWQQWIQWQQQYQQWQQQYGEQYQKSMSALTGQPVQLPILPVQPPLPPVESQLVPPPPEAKPPLPPEEPPNPQLAMQYVNHSHYSDSTKSLSSEIVPQYQNEYLKNSLTETKQKYDSFRFSQPSVNQPPSLLSMNIPKPDVVTEPQPEYGKRPLENPENVEVLKRNKWEHNEETWNRSKMPSVVPSKNVEELSEAEKNFDKQFEDWEAQFNKWKLQNVAHPDKQQYNEYEAKWESWRTQLLERREQMRRKRLGLLGSNPIKPITTIKLGTASPEVKINTENIDLTIDSPKTEIDPLFNLPPKEQRTNVRQRTPIKSIQEPELFKAIANDCIPGLDLVDKEELPKDPKCELKEPDFEAISKGINSILGDEKLLSMLSTISQNKKSNFETKPVNNQSDYNKTMFPSNRQFDNQKHVTNKDLNRERTMSQSPNLRNSDIFDGPQFRTENPSPDGRGPPFKSSDKFQRNTSFGGSFPPENRDRNSFSDNTQRNFSGPENLQRNPFGYSDSQKNSFTDNPQRNSYENSQRSSFADNPERNSFGENCQRNLFSGAENPQRNVFGGPNSQRNSFGDHENLFCGPGNSQRNSFGDKAPFRSVDEYSRGSYRTPDDRGAFSTSSNDQPLCSPVHRGPNDHPLFKGPEQSGPLFKGLNEHPFRGINEPPPSYRGPNEPPPSYRGPNEPPPLYRGPNEPPPSYRGPNEHPESYPPDFQRPPPFRGPDAPFKNTQFRNPDEQSRKFDEEETKSENDFDHYKSSAVLKELENKSKDHFGSRRNADEPKNMFHHEEFGSKPENKTDFRNSFRGSNNLRGQLGSRRSDNNFSFNQPPNFNKGQDNDEFQNLRDPSPQERNAFDSSDFANRTNNFGQPFRRGDFHRRANFNQGRGFPGRGFADFNRGRFGQNKHDQFSNATRGNFHRGNFSTNSADDSDADDYHKRFSEDSNTECDKFNFNSDLPSSKSFPVKSFGPNNFSFDSQNFNHKPPTMFNQPKDSALSFDNSEFNNRSDTISSDQKWMKKRESENRYEPMKYNENEDLSKESNDFEQNNFGLKKCSGDNAQRWEQKSFEDTTKPTDQLSDSKSNDLVDKYGIWDEALILKPATVVDYEHKSLAPPDVKYIEPVQTFDYEHTSKSTLQEKWTDPLRSEKSHDISAPDPPSIGSFERRPDNPNRFERRHENRYERKFERFERRYDENRRFDRKFDDRPFSKFSTKLFDRDQDFSRKFSDKFKPDNDPEYPENEQIIPDKPAKVTMIEDLLGLPGRETRPPRIVIILRGPPGSGKTFLAKLIKDKEVEHGGSAPRILSLDDYFMVESEKEVVEEETGRKTIVKTMEYEYEECMEIAYRSSLDRAFKKTVTDGFFQFIILDCINDKVKHFSDMWSFAKQNGFQVYVCQMELDVPTCTKRNVHHRSEIEIDRLVAGWECAPSHYLILDAASLIQSSCISEVEMEEITEPAHEESEDENAEGQIKLSKWEQMEPSFDKLARLDGINKPLRSSTKTMEDYLQLDDDIPEARPGQKRVRWADLEEKRRQDKMRAIGFVVGQTDWDRMMDPTQGSSALTQTKYIERVRRF